MKKIKQFLLLTFLVSALFFLLFSPSLAASSQPLKIYLQIPIPGLGQELVITGDTLGQYIAALYKFFVGALGIISVVVMMIGGFLWLVSGGSGERLSAAKNTILNAIIGLILAITSYLLLYTLNPSLVNFGSLVIDDIEPALINPFPECDLKIKNTGALLDSTFRDANGNSQCNSWKQLCFNQCNALDGISFPVQVNALKNMSVIEIPEGSDNQYVCCQCHEPTNNPVEYPPFDCSVFNIENLSYL